MKTEWQPLQTTKLCVTDCSKRQNIGGNEPSHCPGGGASYLIIGTSFCCFEPGVERPLAISVSSRDLRRATISGCSDCKFFVSPMSVARLYSCTRGRFCLVASASVGDAQPPEPGQNSSFQFPSRIANCPLELWLTIDGRLGTLERPSNAGK